ncbi:MAG: hypothetical protein ACPGVD_10850 [Flavobacteriales bacterium]
MSRSQTVSSGGSNQSRIAIPTPVISESEYGGVRHAHSTFNTQL